MLLTTINLATSNHRFDPPSTSQSTASNQNSSHTRYAHETRPPARLHHTTTPPNPTSETPTHNERIPTDTSEYHVRTSDTPVYAPGAWFHIRRTTKSTSLLLYLNGQKMGTEYKCSHSVGMVWRTCCCGCFHSGVCLDFC